MQMGLIGLGRMGANMRERIRGAGHDVVGFDPGTTSSDVESLQELVARLATPRVVWVMVPAGEPTRTVIEQLSHLLGAGDLVIDGETRGSPTTRIIVRCWATGESPISIAVCPVVFGVCRRGTA